MRKLTLSALALGGIFLASCADTTPKYVITAQAPEGTADSTLVYLSTWSGDNIDSTYVTKGLIKFENNFTTPELVRVSLSRRASVSFVLEGDTIALDFAKREANGGALNAVRLANNAKKIEISKKIQAAYKEVSEKLADKTLDNKAIEAIKNSFQEKYDNEFQPQLEEVDRDLFNANKNNVLGVAALLSIADNGADAATQEELIAQLDPALLTNKLVVKQKEYLDILKKTSEGEMFTDFTIDQGDGTSKSLSDFVGKGKYVLVDFWASWCGPCRGEIPNLAKVYKKYKGDKFELVSVAVWEDIEASKKGIEELNMVWPQIINGQSIPTELYGIKGIPQIILFGPDGKIIKRDLRGEAINEMLAELIK